MRTVGFIGRPVEKAELNKTNLLLHRLTDHIWNIFKYTGRDPGEVSAFLVIAANCIN
jgi:hypothetical protein